MKKLIIIFLTTLCTAGFVFAGENDPVTPENALQSYLNNGDKSFAWEVEEKMEADGVTLYRIIFTSQKWRELIWKHELTVMVPDDLKYQDALLFITGGSIKNGEPNIHEWDKDEIILFSQIAKTNKAITAIVWQIPNQPIFDGKTEDEIISYTFHNFQSDNDYTWPLLFPMTKSAIRAMDAIQKFASSDLQTKVNEFVVSGASKRGWTTWLTGASDKRVKAIGPMVIDMLNMPVNIPYHKTAWGEYSIQIEDYVKLGVAQQVGSEEGNALVKMIDPYSYRKALTMPKMIFNGSNDEYWPVDAIKNYIDSIPGDNHLCYVPNAGHGLGDKTKAINTLSAFFGEAITGNGHPKCDYTVNEENGTVKLKIKANEKILKDAVLWSAESDDRDIRDETWKEKSLGEKGKKEFTVTVKYPESGFKAFYVDLVYQPPFGNDYTQSTRIFLMNDKEILLGRGE
ncbi:PhoPQ-activated pathogenicity-related family protein [Maribellus maritimus]|uniref:PhoPQ-activated pathogenicity-related family protein n=1 Tax=Maribellus maritimus TaxID=2870838 RepID=UPI001EEB21C2|nr:PhoPQ-activated protein PqaA family protein [Maribellus maritimus]MCG6188064.1 PhoPQ-activated pathogenicity-related family protein [Maribellus maritimus]